MPMRNASSRSTHVADAMTMRPVLRSTAITDHVANARAGNSRHNRNATLARNIPVSCDTQMLISAKDASVYLSRARSRLDPANIAGFSRFGRHGAYFNHILYLRCVELLNEP